VIEAREWHRYFRGVDTAQPQEDVIKVYGYCRVSTAEQANIV